jgi:hypothetical protein
LGLLSYVQDLNNPTHGIIEPAYQMPLEEYLVALAETRHVLGGEKACHR